MAQIRSFSRVSRPASQPAIVFYIKHKRKRNRVAIAIVSLRESIVIVTMVKFLKPNKDVILLQGRFVGRKAVIVKTFDEGARYRRFGYCLVAGIYKYPSKVIHKDSSNSKKITKKSRVKAFIKLVNYRHLMPTRYTFDVYLKDVVTMDSLETMGKKSTACKVVKKRFEERFKASKNRWFFTKLRF